MLPPTPTDANAEAVHVTAKPSSIYIEQSERGQHLNFDFLIKNLTKQKLRLANVELSVMDEAEQLVRRDFVDGTTRSSLEFVRHPAWEAGQSRLFFNPFHSFAASLPLSKLQYRFSFTPEKEEWHYNAGAVVEPIPYETKTDLMLPVKGRVLIWDGHDYDSHHRRFNYLRPGLEGLGYKTNFQRYGYDFVSVNARGEMYEGELDQAGGQEGSVENEAYFGFGSPLYAAGAGRVVAVHDGEADDREFREAELATRETAYGGNFIIIDHLNGEYSWFGHLQQGSICVALHQLVRQGEVIAKMGASGSSLFPHLHYELRDGIGAKEVEGLPSYFRNFRRHLGSKMVVVDKGQIDTGEVLEWVEDS